MKITHATRGAGSTVACPVGSASRLLALAALAGLAVSTAAAQPGVTRSGVRWPAPEALAPVAQDSPSAAVGTEADGLVEPLALYPEQVLIAIFRASQHPLDVVRAARWFKAGNSVEGAAAQPWAANLAGLLEYPAVIEAMDADIDRTQRLGELARTQPEVLWSAIDRQRVTQGQPGVSVAGTQEPAAFLASGTRPASVPLPTFGEAQAGVPEAASADVATFSNAGAGEELSSVILPGTIAAPVWTTPVIVAPYVPRRSVWFVSGWGGSWGSPWCGWNDAWAYRWRSYYSRPSFALSVSIGSDPWRWSRWDCRPVSSWRSSWQSSWHGWPRRSVVVVSRPVSHWGSGWSHWDQPICEPAWDSGLSLSFTYVSGGKRDWGHSGKGHGWNRGHGDGHGYGDDHGHDYGEKKGHDGARGWSRDRGHEGGGDRGGDGRELPVRPDVALREPRARGAFGAVPPEETTRAASGWPLLRATQRSSREVSSAGYEGSRRVVPPEAPVAAPLAASAPARPMPSASVQTQPLRSSSPPGIMRVAERARRSSEPAASGRMAGPSQPAASFEPRASEPSRVASEQAASRAARPIPSIRPSDNLRRGAVAPPAAPRQLAAPSAPNPPAAERRVVRADQPRVEPAPPPAAAVRSPSRVQTGREQRAPRSAYPVARAAAPRASDQAPAPQPRPSAPPPPRAEPAPQASSQPSPAPAGRKPILSIRPRDNIRRGGK